MFTGRDSYKNAVGVALPPEVGLKPYKISTFLPIAYLPLLVRVRACDYESPGSHRYLPICLRAAL